MNKWTGPACLAALTGVIGLAVAMQPRPAAPSPAAGGGDPGASGFVIEGARVFDGERDLGIVRVVVRDGEISAVGADAEAPAGLTRIDGRGRTLLPGLIDAHVHAFGDAQQDMARFGVTGGLDMHGDASRLPSLRAARERSDDSGRADLWAAGFAVTAPGGHGTQYGFTVPTLTPADDVAAFVDARLDEGADFIKLIVEDLGAYGMAQRLPTLSAPQVAAVAEAARARGRPVVVHVATAADARMVVDAGVHGLVHVFADAVADDGLLETFQARDAFVVPTLSVVASMAGSGEGQALSQDPRLQPLLGADQKEALAHDFGLPTPVRLDHAIESVRRMHAAGIDILAGSDAPNPGTTHGASLHHELELLVRAGLTPAQALAAATSRPARRFGLAGRGRIAPGMRADLVLVAGDPLDDIRATRAIEAVWKNGRSVALAIDAALPAAAPPPEATLVSAFDGGSIDASFGSWQATTDRLAGGASDAAHAIVADGAGGSPGALRVTGEVRPGFAFPWAGVMFFPAAQPMQPVDLSGRTELVFSVRGDGRRYSAMLFSGTSAQGMPSVQNFVAGNGWQEVRLPLSGFAGADLARVRGIAFTAGQPFGGFEFVLDQVELR